VIKLGPPVPDGVFTLRSSDVRPLFIDRDAVKRISPKIAAEYQRTTLRGGEVLVTVRGTLGGIAVAPSEMAGWNVSREVAVLPVLAGRCLPSYLVFGVASIHCQNWLAERAKGVAYTGINIEDLKELPIPTAPLPEQHEIVRRVDALFMLADAIEARVAAATARADKITQAILAKAFRGELVPTEAELARHEGRDYEPASALLAHIRAARAGDAAAKPAMAARRQTEGVQGRPGSACAALGAGRVPRQGRNSGPGG
jgi:type I restriction enzyme S subunit